MDRTYDIHLTDANDCVCAMWTDLSDVDLMGVLSRITPTKGHFISVYVRLIPFTPETSPNDLRGYWAPKED